MSAASPRLKKLSRVLNLPSPLHESIRSIMHDLVNIELVKLPLSETEVEEQIEGHKIISRGVVNILKGKIIRLSLVFTNAPKMMTIIQRSRL